MIQLLLQRHGWGRRWGGHCGARLALANRTGGPILAAMTMESGFLHLGRFRGVPLRMHVLAPLGALFFSGFRFEPGAWLGFVLIILLHEIGHALLVMRYRL